MSCPDPVSRLLEPYLDGELDVVRSLEVERHLSSCAVCSGALGDHRALRAALADASLHYEAPRGFEDGMRAAVRKAAGAPPPRATSNARWWAVAASLSAVAATVVALAVVRAPSEQGLDHEVVSAHVRSLMADHLTDVASSDRHTVKPWFNGRLDFSPTVNDLAQDGYPLIGGRLDYVGGHPAAALVYGRGNHVVNVFVWPATAGDGSDGESSLRGYNVIRWRHAAMSYCAVSDLNVTELRELARLLQR
jgi:anti-sigma factor RsiW